MPDGKTLTFAWPNNLYHAGRFVFYNRQGSPYHERIVGSTVSFFLGEDIVYIGTISSSDSITTIAPEPGVLFNRVVLTFSGNEQNFREIEIYGKSISTVNSVSITGNNSVFMGGTDTLIATVFATDSQTRSTVTGTNPLSVTWSSLNPSKVTVNSLGVVTGVAVGTATITATSIADTTKRDSMEITVPTPTVTRVTITGKDSVLWKGIITLKATVTGTNVGQAVKWSSSDAAVATVESLTGVVTGVDTGTVTITATSIVDNSKQASRTIVVTPQENLVSSAEITTTVTNFYRGDSTANINRLKDGVKNSDDTDAALSHPLSANGKKIEFAWTGKLFHAGSFVLYNRIDCCSDRINGSTVEFFNGNSSIYLDTISSGGDTVTIAPALTARFNKIVLTFSGTDQNFREIEIFGTPTPATVDRISITGDYSAWVGHTVLFSATITGTNISRTVKWSSSDENVATVDSITGVVTGVGAGTAEIIATSVSVPTETASKTIAIVPVQTNVAPRADITTTVTEFWEGDSASNVNKITDGVNSDARGMYADLKNPQGKDVTFAWPSNLYHTGRFVLYNREHSCCYNRINGSRVEFFHGEDRVHQYTISNAGSGDTVIIILPADSTFNKVVLTFPSGKNAQNIREIEIFGTPTASTVTGVSIAGDYSIWVGYTAPFSATVTGINAPQTVKWSSSDENVATVDSITGVVTGVGAGTAEIIATSALVPTQTASKTIAIIPVQTNNLARSASVTTTVTSFFNGNASTNIARLRDGVTNSDDVNTALVHPRYAQGKKFTFAWPSKLYHTGRFVFYNRSSNHDRIDGSTVEFFNGDSSVYLDTITNAGDTVTIVPILTARFNKVVLTFRTSGDGSQNFREIEIFGTPTPATVDGVSIAGDYFTWVGSTASYSATVTGINAPQTVKWSSSDENVATVDSITGVVTGVSTGTATITATSALAPTQTASKTIAIIPEQTNVARSASVTTTVTRVWDGFNSGNPARVQKQLRRVTDGRKNSDNGAHLMIPNQNANGKTITFAWPNNNELFTHGRFVFYNRQGSSYHRRIVGSTVEFFNGDSSVHLDTITSSGAIITIIALADFTFNKVVLTFSGNNQNFREIEIYGTPIPSIIYDSISIAGSDTVALWEALPP